MDWRTAALEIGVVSLVSALVYLAARRWAPRASDLDFEPELSITRKNGWALLDLVLVNRSKTTVWAEEATFAVADLDADFQGATATGQSTLKLCDNVEPGETQRISLIETVYVAAGKPQGEYSFLISGTVRYRVGNTWYEVSLQTYRVRMVALTAVRLLRMRWYDQPAAKSGTRNRLRKLSGSAHD